MDSVLLALSLLVGGSLTVQAAANVQLNAAVRSPAAAAALQLGIAAGLLLTLAAGLGTLDALAAAPDAAWWHLIGGLGSSLYITTGIVLFPRLGALTSVGLFITGQMLGSVALDTLGLLGLDRQPLSPSSGLGALAVVGGMAVIVGVGQLSGHAAPLGDHGRRRIRWLSGGSTGVARRTALIGVGLVAGAGLPIQAAVNAQLRADLDAPVAAAAFSFVVATTAMLVILVLRVAARRDAPPALRHLSLVPWWGWLGGIVGASYVTTTLLAVPEIGAAATIALTIAGQQLASVLVDHRGLLRLPRRPITGARFLGVALLLSGAAIVQLS